MTDQTSAPNTAHPGPATTGFVASAKPDPFTAQEKEFHDKLAAIHKAAPGVIAKVEAEAKAAGAKAETVALDTIDDIKAEATVLEARFRALATRIEDMTVRGVENPVFKAAANMVAHVASIAKSL